MSDAPEPRLPSTDELDGMTAEEAMFAGANQDGVQIVHRRDRFPIPGSKAEKRAEPAIARLCHLVLAAVAFVVVFIAVPFHHMPGKGSQTFTIYSRCSARCSASASRWVPARCSGQVAMPEEEAVQDRHDGPSRVEEQMLTSATLISGLEDTGLARRSLLKSSLGLAGIGLGIVPLVALVGGLLKKPGNQLQTTLLTTGVPVVFANGARVGPGTLQAGGIATVFPGVPGGITAADSPTLLIRLRPDQVVHARKGQAGFGGDYAVLKDLHPRRVSASLYEQETGGCSAVPSVAPWSPRTLGLRSGHAGVAEVADHRAED